MTNIFRTAKFSRNNWLATALWLQFKRPVNIYFLLITLIHFMEDSPKNPYVNLLTFTVFIAFLIFKDLYEDLPSQKYDKKKNKQLQDVYSFPQMAFRKRPA